jgi:hypothetical protein
MRLYDMRNRLVCTRYYRTRRVSRMMRVEFRRMHRVHYTALSFLDAYNMELCFDPASLACASSLR